MPHNSCGMLIRCLSEREITREGGAIPRVQDRDKEALAMQKSGNNANNHWSFKCNWQGVSKVDKKITYEELLHTHVKNVLVDNS